MVIQRDRERLSRFCVIQQGNGIIIVACGSKGLGQRSILRTAYLSNCCAAVDRLGVIIFLFREHHNDPLALTPYHDTQTQAVQRERT